MTSQFGGTYNVSKSGGSTINGSLVTKKLTVKGTDAAETIIGGNDAKSKTTFKGGGGADSLVGGAGADTFFYAKGDTGTATIANFDFSKDKLKIAGGTLAKVSSISGGDGGVQFAMKNGKNDPTEIGWFNVASSLKADGGTETIDASKVAIKANNTYYWFAQGTVSEEVTTEGAAAGTTVTLASAGDLITWSDKKVSSSDVSGYNVIELNYSTNLVKASVASAVSSTLTNAKLK